MKAGEVIPNISKNSRNNGEIYLKNYEQVWIAQKGLGKKRSREYRGLQIFFLCLFERYSRFQTYKTDK